MGVNVKVGSETFGGTSKAWLATRKGLQDMRGITLDMSTFNAGDVINGYIPSGIPIGKITSGGKYGPYDDAASDGRQVMQGHLFEDTKVDTGDVSTATDSGGALFWTGVVVEAKLPATHFVVDTNGKADVAKLIRYE